MVRKAYIEYQLAEIEKLIENIKDEIKYMEK